MKRRATKNTTVLLWRAGAVVIGMVFFAGTTLPAQSAGSPTCPGVDLVETDLENGKSSGYYIPGLKLIILNRTILQSDAESVRRFILAHECAHADPEVGEDEMNADCAASKGGITQGWLGAEDLIKVCTHLSRFPADATHPPIQVRCANIRRCAREAEFEIARKSAFPPEKEVARTPLMARNFE